MKVVTHFLFCLVTVSVHVTGSDVAKRAATTAPSSVAHLTSVTSKLSTTLDQLNAKIDTLSADLTQKATQIGSLNTQITHQNGVIKNLTSQLNHETNQADALDTFCKSHVTDLTNRVESLEHPIAFTARFSNDSVGRKVITVGRWQHLAFDVINYQTGGQNYNASTGLFTAPSTGSYAFFLSIQRNDPEQNDCLSATVMKNTNAWITTATACPSGYTSASNMAIAWMRSGDKAFVRTMHSERVFGYVHTSFSGMKLATQ